jgi:hypothetical protein
MIEWGPDDNWGSCQSVVLRVLIIRTLKKSSRGWVMLVYLREIKVLHLFLPPAVLLLVLLMR